MFLRRYMEYLTNDDMMTIFSIVLKYKSCPLPFSPTFPHPRPKLNNYRWLCYYTYLLTYLLTYPLRPLWSIRRGTDLSTLADPELLALLPSN